MRWLLTGIGVLLGGVVLLGAIGYAMPNAHVTQVRADYAATPAEVYAVLANVEGWPEWHPSVDSLAPLEGQPEEPAWRIVGPDGTMDIVVASVQPPTRLVTRVDGGMFVGRWTYQVDSRPRGSRVTVTEEARIDNPVIRGLTVLWSQAATMERMLRALGDHLGERITPERIT